MLEGRGIDFESIGMAMGYRRDLEALTSEANAQIQACNAVIHREVAMNAGRTAQLHALFEALAAVDPENPALQPTGLHWPSGAPQLRYEAVYTDAYDAVAKARGIPPSRRAMTARDRAYDAVMREPIETRRVMVLFRRPFWRGEEYVDVRAAERARRQAAEQARAAA